MSSFRLLNLPFLFLIAANLIPMAGVVWWGWDAAQIVLLYWAENLVVGFYNILGIALLPAKNPIQHLAKLGAIPFFCIHFGGFCAVHGLFLCLFFKIGNESSMFPSVGEPWLGPLVFVQLLVGVVTNVWRHHPPGMAWPFIALVLSHGVSFVYHYFMAGERHHLNIGEFMSRPYKRIVVLHIAIIAGGFFIMTLGSPLPLLFLLILLKIGVDVKLHWSEHRRSSSEEPEEIEPESNPA